MRWFIFYMGSAPFGCRTGIIADTRTACRGQESQTTVSVFLGGVRGAGNGRVSGVLPIANGVGSEYFQPVMFCLTGHRSLVVQVFFGLLPILLALSLMAAVLHVEVIGSLRDIIMRNDRPEARCRRRDALGLGQWDDGCRFRLRHGLGRGPVLGLWHRLDHGNILSKKNLQNKLA